MRQYNLPTSLYIAASAVTLDVEGDGYYDVMGMMTSLCIAASAVTVTLDGDDYDVMVTVNIFGDGVD